jgi:hypothetical protein
MSDTEQRVTKGGRARPFSVPVLPAPQPMESPERAALPAAPETKSEPAAPAGLVPEMRANVMIADGSSSIEAVKSKPAEPAQE